MKLLLDTHLVLWAAAEPHRLSDTARDLMAAPDNQLLCSVASLWEVAIKSSLGRPDFRCDVGLLRSGLAGAGYVELEVTGDHASRSRRCRGCMAIRSTGCWSRRRPSRACCC